MRATQGLVRHAPQERPHERVNDCPKRDRLIAGELLSLGQERFTLIIHAANGLKQGFPVELLL